MPAAWIPICAVALCLLCRHGAEGRTVLEGRIMTHTTAPKGRFPWMVSLRDSYGWHVCGGAIIDPWHVLTAAHCITRLGQHILLYIGGHNIHDDDESGVQVLISESAFVHPRWTGDFASGFDVALLRLPREVHVTFPSLADHLNSLSQGEPLAALGWGYVCEKEVSDLRMATMLEVIDNPDCPGIPNLPDNMMCAYSQWEDACQGDSGGPLAKFHAPHGRLSKGSPHHDMIHGIVSHGPHCCNEATGGAYTRVAHVRDWIDATRDGKNTWAPVRKGHRPLLVSLLDRHREHFCTGVQIEKHFVLTAAHCIDATGPNPLVAVESEPGKYDKAGFGMQELPIERTFVHPQYTGQVTDGYDVALLQLRQPILWAQSMHTCLLPLPLLAPGTFASSRHVHGFRFKGRAEVAQLEIIDSDHCPHLSKLGDHQFCAYSNLTSVEPGIGGGPILGIEAHEGGKNEMIRVIGIISFANLSAANESRIGCTSVSGVHDWIEGIIHHVVPGVQVTLLAITLALLPFAAAFAVCINVNSFRCSINFRKSLSTTRMALQSPP